VRLPPVAEEGQKLPKDKDWWRDEDLGKVDESTEGFPLPPKHVLVKNSILLHVRCCFSESTTCFRVHALL
jgi:hypothetical protein